MVRNSIWRVYRNRLFASIFVTLCLAAYLVSERSFVHALLFGPPIVSMSALVQTSAPTALDGDWVRVLKEKNLDLPATFDPTLRNRYFVISADYAYLLVRGADVGGAGYLRGKLHPALFGREAEIIQRMERDFPEVKGRFAPFVLDHSASLLLSYLWLLLTGSLLGGAMWLGNRFLVGTEKPLDQREAHRLKSYGVVEGVIEEIETDLSETKYGIGRSLLGERWLMGVSLFQVFFVPFRDIISVDENRRLPLLYVKDAHGNRYSIAVAQKDRERLRAAIQSKIAKAA